MFKLVLEMAEQPEIKLPTSVQVSLSHVQLFATPWTAVCQASLSVTNCWSLPKPMSIESVMLSNHIILCHPFLLLPSIFPSMRVFSNESTLHIRWPKYWSFSFNISPSNEHPGMISFRMDWLDLLGVQGTLKSLLQHHSSKASVLRWIIKKAREFQKNTYFCFIDYTTAFDCVDHHKLWKILKEMGIPDHLTCLLWNLYAGQEATVRSGHGTTDWFQIGKGVRRGCILSLCLFNLYAEYIMSNAGLEEAQAGIKIARRNIHNLRYAEDPPLPPLWQKAKKN